MNNIKREIWPIFIVAMFCLSVFFPREASALSNCCRPNHPDVGCRVLSNCAYNPALLLACCYSACPYENWTNTTLDKCEADLGVPPSNTCCTTDAACSSNCGSISKWYYCYGTCQIKADPTYEGQCLYQYQYNYTKCGAQDTCKGTVYLYAGKCGGSGCEVGGRYKVCCNSDGTVDGNCSGGQFDGTCGDKTAKFCGFDSYPSCDDTAAVCSYGVAPTSTPVPTNTPSCVCTDPAKVSLTSPVNGATNQSLTVRLSWGTISAWGEDCSTGDNYDYKVWRGTSESDLVIVATLDHPTALFDNSGLAYNTTYHWKIESYNGCRPNYSDIWSFTTVPQFTPTPTLVPTATPTPTPTLACPALTVEAKISVTNACYYSLTWTDAGAETGYDVLRDDVHASYRTVQDWTDSNGGNYFPWGATHTYDVQPYYIQANPVNCQQNVSATCPTATPTPTPAIVCPAVPVGVTDVAFTVLGQTKFKKTLTWNNVANEEGYKIYRCQGTSCAIPPDTGYVTSVASAVDPVTLIDDNGGVGFDPGTDWNFEIRSFRTGYPIFNCDETYNGFPTLTPTPTSTPTNTPTPTPAIVCPSVPVGVTDVAFTVLGQTKFKKTLTWNNVANEEGYKIYRCEGTICAIPPDDGYVTSLGVNVVTYTDSNNGGVGFDPGTDWNFEVRPFKTGYPVFNCPETYNGFPTLTPTPTPALVIPSCSNVTCDYTASSDTMTVNYDFAGNNTALARLRTSCWYNPGTWSEFSVTHADPGNKTGPKECSKTNPGEGNWTFYGQLNAYYDLNSNNRLDTGELRMVCSGTDGTCSDCWVSGCCVDRTPPPVPVPTVSPTIACPGATVNVTWGAVTDPAPSCGGLSYRYKVSVGGVEKASGTTTNTTFSTSATLTSGDYLVEVFSRDGSDNESLAGTATFKVDGVAPAVPVCSALGLNPPTTFNVDWEDAADNSGGIGLHSSPYYVEASLDNFTSTCKTAFPAASQWSPGTDCLVLPDNTGYARVKVRDVCNNWSDYDTCEYPRTGCSSSVTIMDVARAAEGYTLYNKNVSWTAVDGVDGYKIYLCEGASCAIPLAADAYYVTTIASGTTSVVLPTTGAGFLPGTTVKIEVRPYKGTQQVANCNDYVNNFCAAPNMVIKTLPVNDTKACLRYFDFTLSDGADSGCYEHDAYFGIYSAGDSLLYNSGWKNDLITTFGVSATWTNTIALPDAAYLWRGRTRNSAGLFGPYDSSPWNLCVDCVPPPAPACQVIRGTPPDEKYHFVWSAPTDVGCANMPTPPPVPYHVNREVIDILARPVLTDESDRIPTNWGADLLFSLNSGECVRCRVSAKDEAGNSSAYGSWSDYSCYDAPVPTSVPTSTPTNTPVPTNTPAPTNTPTPIPGCPVVYEDFVWIDALNNCRIRIGWNDMVGEDFYYVEKDALRLTSVGQNTVLLTDPDLLVPGQTYDYNVNPVYGGVEKSPDCPATPIICPALPTNTPTPTVTPTCAPTDPNQPQPKSPPNGKSDWPRLDVDLEWYAVASWGDDCAPGSNNRYKVYLTDNAGFAGDGDLSNNGGTLTDNVGENILLSSQSGLVDQKTYYWQIEANNGARHVLSAVWSFTVDLSANRWWQTKDGDIYAVGNIYSQIPPTATSRYLSIAGAGGSPGVVGWGGANSPSLSSGLLSWRAKTAYLGPNIGFDYLVNRLEVNKTDSFSGAMTMPAESGIYYSSVAKDLTGAFPGGKKIIIFVDGDVTVQENIVVPVGSFFALISSGNITFANSVTSAQGFFLADGTLSTGTANQQFIGEGSFIGKSVVSMGRDLDSVNTTTPGELFISRPDLFINAPANFLFTPSFFQEVAP